MLKLAQTDRQTNRPTNRQGKNNMSPTTILAQTNRPTNQQTNRQGKNNMSPTTICLKPHQKRKPKLIGNSPTSGYLDNKADNWSTRHAQNTECVNQDGPCIVYSQENRPP
ncbi:hypothetical protein DPMN_173073 [Dreissena polymorpha]|uniref:Uncharacterized protein n=1 Tax=Dreissena polymorpha TaxID=45954 RepID=A0A9D4E3I3_DREPO|nr:hypothetical protein DPMN_173073 [Dreissena polymorpha]